MVVKLIGEAINSGARQAKACNIIGLKQRNYQRWKKSVKVKPDGRTTNVRPAPQNKLTQAEIESMRAVLRCPEYEDLPPSQFVPKLADNGVYIASESSFYRLMKADKLNVHRGKTKAPVKRVKTTHTATAPNQIWCWDITYLPGPAVGIFFYLYLVLDIFSRKIVAWEVHNCERSELASDMIQKAYWREGLHQKEDHALVLHSDNGSPMKGSSLQVKLADLKIEPSFSRPRVSNDNAYAESIFKTVKYRPNFPYNGFAVIEDAQIWVGGFADWYNEEHQHSGIKCLTPNQRHSGEDVKKTEGRIALYEQSQAINPLRWSGKIRNWVPPTEVHLNPDKIVEN
jgi:putative transposase